MQKSCRTARRRKFLSNPAANVLSVVTLAAFAGCAPDGDNDIYDDGEGDARSESELAAGTTYYVDSVAGADTNDGASVTSPWKSLAKVNNTTFQPGDHVRFKAGGVWNGQLHPKGSGTGNNSIYIDMYGTGAKPVINGGGNTSGAVYLFNQQYWEIRNLEVTNLGATRKELVGIRVLNDTGGQLNHIYVGSCTVHDVNGFTTGFYGTNGGITVTANMDTNSHWNDVTIESNYVYAVDRIGIMVGPSFQNSLGPVNWATHPRSTNVVIQNNTIDDSGGDAILNFVTANVLVQHNVVSNCGGRTLGTNPTYYRNEASAGIWNAISEHTTFQYNEVYGELDDLDGQAYDVDTGTNHTTVQYNYSHHNRGGFILFCESGSPLQNNDVKVRFNIIHGTTPRAEFNVCRTFPRGPDKVDINNNTIYVRKGQSTKMFDVYGANTSIPGTAYIYNNIFYVLGTTSYDSLPESVLDYNVFYGNHPPTEPIDGHKLTSDPRLVMPGSAGLGIDSVSGYQLQAGSPAIGSGTNTGGANLGPKDYWGNAVSPTAAPNRGAYNGPGVAGVNQNLAFNATVTASSSYDVSSWNKLNAVDGQRESVLDSSGYTSRVGATNQHSEWFEINFGSVKRFGKVVLYPRSTSGLAGAGFPVDFRIQVWNGSIWLDRVVQADYEQPGGTPQEFTWGFSDSTDKVRILATRLRQVGAEYMMQLAEVEVYDLPSPAGE